ncbi:MAG: CPBP family intramembrane metalloprotease [Clostridiales bacterium]|nr:CPBP family intramembrane metalloprotease [Clostridiales bacterium]
MEGLLYTRRAVRRHFARLGAAVLVLWGAGNILGAVLVEIIGNLIDMGSDANMLLSSLSLWVLGLPLAWLILRKRPTIAQAGSDERELRPVRGGTIPLYFLMVICLTTSANLIGTGIEWLLSQLPGVSGGNISDILAAYALELSPWTLFLYLVVIAPLCEEFFFRKLLLDRAAQYGHVPAMLFSGILFGAMHGNIAQSLNAAAAGIILAHVYLTYGKLWLCLVLHILNNTLSFVSLLAFRELSETAYMNFTALYGFIMIGLCIAGGVLLIKRAKKLRLLQRASLPHFSRLSFGNWSVILFLVFCGLMVVSTLLL